MSGEALLKLIELSWAACAYIFNWAKFLVFAYDRFETLLEKLQSAKASMENFPIYVYFNLAVLSNRNTPAYTKHFSKELNVFEIIQ